MIKNLALVFLFSSALLLSISAMASDSVAPYNCRLEVGKFLATPNKQSMIVLLESRNARCWAVIKSSNVSLDKLINLAEQGNLWAAQYLANNLKNLDGGNLEDSLIGLGGFSDHDMVNLLVFAQKGILSEQDLSDALTMLPLSLSDNPQAQLEILKVRRETLTHITQKDLLVQRTIALDAIDSFISEIESKSSNEDS